MTSRSVCVGVQGTETPSCDIKVCVSWCAGYRESRMLGQVPEDVLTYLRNEPVTQNEHQYGMLVDVSSLCSTDLETCNLQQIWTYRSKETR